MSDNPHDHTDPPCLACEWNEAQACEWNEAQKQKTKRIGFIVCAGALFMGKLEGQTFLVKRRELSAVYKHVRDAVNDSGSVYIGDGACVCIDTVIMDDHEKYVDWQEPTP